jgi:toluene methyl-monooxygenase
MWDHIRYYLNNLLVLVGTAGFILGSQWVWLGSVGVLIIMLLGDLILGADEGERNVKYPWIANLSLYLHVPLTILLYVAFAWRLKEGFNEPTTFMTVLAYAGCVASASFMGNIPNVPISHELWHRKNSFEKFLGFVGGVFWGNPMRDLPHLYIHHLHVGTPKDADTARRGQSVYSYALRTSWLTFVEAFQIEKEFQNKKGRSVFSLRSRVTWSIILIAMVLVGFYFAAGWFGVGIVAITLFIAKLLVEGFNYTQHYGIVRVPGTPIEERHSWEHRKAISRIGGLEITTHAHHHYDGYVRFYDLKPSKIDNRMPSVVVCFLMALVPPLWFKFVQAKLKKWDLTFATPEELKLAKEANERAGWPNWFDNQSTQTFKSLRN